MMNSRFALPLLLLASIPACKPAKAEDEGAIHVDVSKFRNTKGKLYCMLFTKEEGFPNGNGFRGWRGPIEGESSPCSFGSLPKGTYAVSLYHDENDNGKLDTNFFGAPTEGYGVSNNKTYAFSTPKWEESKFELAAGEKKKLKVNLRY